MIEINLKEQNIETTEVTPLMFTSAPNVAVSMRTFILMERAGKQYSMKDFQHIN